LHQLIKGTFKDHLVTWVGEYLAIEHGQARANEIMDDIDRRYCFSQYKGFIIFYLFALLQDRSNTIISWFAAIPTWP